MNASVVVDGVEVKDPSPWLAEARDIAAASVCKIRWLTFAMAAQPPADRAVGIFFSTDNGAIQVLHYDEEGNRVTVPMLTSAEQELCAKVDFACALNMAHLERIEFIIDPADDDQRRARASVIFPTAA
jgi:hypothetical protein